jgi:hypothetical protein
MSGIETYFLWMPKKKIIHVPKTLDHPEITLGMSWPGVHWGISLSGPSGLQHDDGVSGILFC